MVVFTCQHCGESVNKPKVEKHYQTKCRRNSDNAHLTCVDCLKDFRDLEYKAHSQCMTEGERYAAEGTVFKESKGKNKQAIYTDMIQNLLNSTNLSNVQRKLLVVCSNHTNVPRKQAKFHNFMLNAARTVNHTVDDEKSVFQLIEDAWKKVQSTSNNTPDKVKSDKIKETSEQKKETEQLDTSNEENTSKNTTPKSNKKTKKHNKTNGSFAMEEEIRTNTNGKSEDAEVNLNNISKKKLKKLKKREKYLTELENNSNEKVGEQADEEEGTKDSLKKNKRKKHAQKEGNKNDFTNSMEVASEENIPKKSKKRKLGDTPSEIIDKKLKTEGMEVDNETEATGAFDWANTITRVLQRCPDKELSLKRLGKKVIDEYQTLQTDHNTYNDLLAKFNKKVKKTRGVRVLKDKAKLIE